MSRTYEEGLNDGMLDMVAKTVMRKKDFKTSNQKLKV